MAEPVNVLRGYRDEDRLLFPRSEKTMICLWTQIVFVQWGERTDTERTEWGPVAVGIACVGCMADWMGLPSSCRKD
jgi:hypothetical protein